jgi:imidazolonepropionase-like amidohydrolase
MKKNIALFYFCYLSATAACAQIYEFKNGKWLVNGKFISKTIYTSHSFFTFNTPLAIDSSIDLNGQYCIPPFGDAHTHNLDGAYNLKEMALRYIKEGVFYVQVLGNYGSGAMQARPLLKKENALEATYANGLLTATYGHGFYPYEPMAMGFYNPSDQFKYADSVKKSRKANNIAYYFLDSISDVDNKWPLIMKYKPDHIKICLLDAADYAAKRKAEKVETYGLSPEVAAYVVKKAHAAGLRVFAHVETADDARLCAKIGVDALAHLPGYGWNGDEATRGKYCMTKADVKLFKKVGLTVIPTMNIDHTKTYDDNGNITLHPERFATTLNYEKTILRYLYTAKVPIALGADYYGKTVAPEIDSLIAQQIFTAAQLLDLWGKQTTQHIFPNRKLGEIKEGYEANFLVLKGNPIINIESIKTIVWRIKLGKFIIL